MHIGAGGVQVIHPRSDANWWQSGGASGCVAAYQAKGAANYAASLVNLANPGTLDLTIAVAPSWTAAAGWTTYCAFDELTYLDGGDFTVFWRGSVLASDTTPEFLGGAGGWAGLLGHVFGNGYVFCGANANATPRFYITFTAGDRTFCYIKLADLSQRLFINNVEVAGSPKAGTQYTVNDLSVFTSNGSSCKAVAFYSGELSNAQRTAVYTAMAAL